MHHPYPKQPLPQVIILYGPAGSGKGTQAEFLLEMFPSYYHLDFGTEFRNYVNLHLSKEIQDNINQQTILEESQDPTSDFERALRIHNNMTKGKPVYTSDLRSVVEKKIIETVQSGTGMIIEGPGRLIEEAEWLSRFFGNNGITISIFHLHLTLEDIIQRIKNRYFIPGSNHPYKSYEEAKAHCPPGVEPYKRKDDIDTNLVVERYRTMYKKNFAKILFIYQLNARAQVFILDASRSVNQVRADIENNVRQYYNVFTPKSE